MASLPMSQPAAATVAAQLRITQRDSNSSLSPRYGFAARASGAIPVFEIRCELASEEDPVARFYSRAIRHFGAWRPFRKNGHRHLRIGLRNSHEVWNPSGGRFREERVRGSGGRYFLRRSAF